MPADGGEIHLSTRYRHGVRLAIPGTRDRVALPIQVSVRDNGLGIPEDLRTHLFDAFVTTKAGGRGGSLLCDETDRSGALVDRLELFSDDRPIERTPVNIHEVLEHVRKLATSGFARNLDFMESYDPSLPPVYGNRDMLVQVLLNLVKNGAEAMPADGGEIHLSTRYRHGVRLAIPGTRDRVALPIQVSVRDNGLGIPEDLRTHLFDAFVTTKAGGKGLGLALVAKIVGDHGGVIEFDSEPRRTEFRVMLPVVSTGTGSE